MLSLRLLLFFPLTIAAVCPSGYIYNPDLNRCYNVHADTAPFFASRTYCTWEGGDLASIHNGFENSYISGLLNHANNFYWIGIRRHGDGDQSEWSWTDNFGAYPSYYNWAPGQPVADVSLWSGKFVTKTQQWTTAKDSDWYPYVCTANPIVPPPTCPPPPQCPTVSTAVAACEDGWTIYSKTNSCYKLITGVGDFLDAEESCDLLDAHLASIHNWDENNFVYNLAHTGAGNMDTSNQIWIGLYFTEGNWTTVDGSKVDYTNWNKGYPADGLCAVMLTDFQSANAMQTKWITSQCDSTERAHVCKKPIH